MRGSRGRNRQILRRPGIIPAHAGLTYLFRGKIICPGDHPRACGAHNYAGVFCTGYMGSSPRMRGSLPPRCILPSPRGIIPAHAGLTRRGPSSAAGRKDHPRACGAHPFFDPELPLDLGSSPRMRGSLTAMRTTLMQPGIIPAHAGLTIGVEAAWLVWRDHPRACGAHFENPSQMCYNRGSSPRMRGSPGRQVSVQEFTGIIPAHAGLTYFPWNIDYRGRDHPRACGAHSYVVHGSNGMEGSSPRMRGSHRRQSHTHLDQRIIPAHAGLTLKNPNIDAILSGPHPIFYSVLRVIR